MENLMLSPVLWLSLGIIFTLFVIGAVLSRMYQRASKEISFVRTGLGGQKVIMNGGALVLPVVHETIPVNMNTLRLEVRRSNEQALITLDRMRIDVLTEFYVRVQPTSEAIASAAQTLGQRTMRPEALKELVEGKFVDSLRSVAAEMTMEDLHVQRVKFVQRVQATVSEDLLKNGLELEAVSLTGLDQTKLEYLDPKNAFDAQGLTWLTETIEGRRKQRNDIEQDTQVAIELKNLEAERQRLEIARDVEYARLSQQRELEIRRAQQVAEIAQQRAERQREATQAEISAKQQVDQSTLSAKQVLDQQRIQVERAVKEQDIARVRDLETAEIARRKAVELAEQDRAIVIAEKSKAQSEAQAEADRARALAVQAEEAVSTTREREKAERAKVIELVKAAERAERDAIAVTVAASAEKKASEDRAAAVTVAAESDAERIRLVARGNADAEKLRAEAAALMYSVDAQGRRALHEAENILSTEQIAMNIRLALIKALPQIIAESVKPLEQIDSIKIVQVDGLHNGARSEGGSAHGGNGGNGGNGNLADQLVSSALRYRAQAPVLDSLLKEIGLEGIAPRELVRGAVDAQAPAATQPQAAALGTGGAEATSAEE
jgi:uncharacterized membrane protein YqiK